MSLNLTESRHLERVRQSSLERFTPASVSKWICEKTYLRGKKFSFSGREYQQRILDDPSIEKVIRKPSQVGLSELTLRIAMAQVNIIPYFTCIYTLPTAGFASTFVKTRLDPIIAECPEAKEALNPLLDNSEVKNFASSFLYFRGCAAGNAATSTPADALLEDEIDFSDPEILSQYESRITASPYKFKTKLSTPTLPDYGIDLEFKNSRRHFQFVKCSHCNTQFLPSYYKHVHVPGYDKHLDEIKKHHLPHIRWQEAVLLCPSCGKAPSMEPQYREWVLENPDENHVAAGYQVQPFDASSFITIPSLIKTSTSYLLLKDFRNFALGQVMEDADSMLAKEELNALFVHAEAAGHTRVIGLDLGMTCHLFVGDVQTDDSIVVIHAERIPIGALRERLPAISLQYNVAIIVSDSQPYTETIMGMQNNLQNLWGAIYVRSKSLSLYTLKDVAEGTKDGEGLLRQVNVNRDKGFDAYMGAIRGAQIRFRATQEQSEIVTQHVDMKRVKIYDDSGEMIFTWKKSPTGNDHFHHAGLYMFIASKMRGAAHVTSSSSFLMRGMHIPDKVVDTHEDFYRQRVSKL